MVKLLILLLSFSICLSERIAIIGAGIGGSSAAHYLLRNKDIKVDIYEKSDRVGGRIQSVNIKGHTINVGASFFIKDNKLIYDLVKELNIEINSTQALKAQQTTAILRGYYPFFYVSNYSIINMVKFIWRYGLAPLYTKKLISDNVKEFVKVYAMLDNHTTFDNVADYLKTMKMTDLVLCTIEEYLVKNGIDQKYIDEVVNAFAAGIYNQDKTIGAFAGFITLAGAGNEAFEITKGNDYLIQTLVNKLKENPNFKLFLNTSVNNIKKQNGKYYIGETEYDRVIIGCPLEKTGIKFENITIKNPGPHSFKDTHVIVVEGEVNSAYFNQGKENVVDIPNSFYVTNKNLTENISDLIYRGNNITTIQGDNNIPERGFKILKEGYKVLYRKYWEFAYPKFEKVQLEDLPSFILDKGLYYINAIETAGSCQELSMLAARNVVNMIEKNLGIVIDKGEDKKDL
jgi:prenylcysteine oxidase/farnesylcysteine lyase